MIENAWNEYRGWAKRASDLQADSHRWARWAMSFAVLAAVLGVAAGQVETAAPWSRVLAFLAAACAAVTPVLGQDILAVGREAGWIRARAAAEAIKSECFRYAAGVGEYAGGDAAKLFYNRRDEITATATRSGLVPLQNSDAADQRRPHKPVEPTWYVKHRLQEQKDFYTERQVRNEVAVRWLRNLSLAAAIVAAVLGAASAVFDIPSMASWIGVLTTLGAMLLGYGLMERRQYLAVSYGAMAGALGRLEERFSSGAISLPELVQFTEDLLAGEHAAWSERMTKTISAPPAASPAHLPEAFDSDTNSVHKP